MNAKMAKRLRRMAREEMSGDANLVDRELVIATIKGHDRLINEPISIRSMTLQLKKAYKAARRAGP